MAARAGHDLVIEAERWNASVSLEESGQTESHVRVIVDATSLRVRDASGGIKALTDEDRDEIRRNVAQALQSAQHPEIRFVSTAIETLDGARWEIVGDLTLAGRTGRVRFPVEVETRSDGIRMRARAKIAQSGFGIEPFTAMIGSLRVADEVEIAAEAWAPTELPEQAS